MRKNCELVIVHAGDGSDIEGVYVLDEAQSSEMWAASDPFEYICQQEEGALTQFHTISETFAYITKKRLTIQHECAVGSY